MCVLTYSSRAARSLQFIFKILNKRSPVYTTKTLSFHRSTLQMLKKGGCLSGQLRGERQILTLVLRNAELARHTPAGSQIHSRNRHRNGSASQAQPALAGTRALWVGSCWNDCHHLTQSPETVPSSAHRQSIPAHSCLARLGSTIPPPQAAQPAGTS